MSMDYPEPEEIKARIEAGATPFEEATAPQIKALLEMLDRVHGQTLQLGYMWAVKNWPLHGGGEWLVHIWENEKR